MTATLAPANPWGYRWIDGRCTTCGHAGPPDHEIDCPRYADAAIEAFFWYALGADDPQAPCNRVIADGWDDSTDDHPWPRQWADWDDWK